MSTPKFKQDPKLTLAIILACLGLAIMIWLGMNCD